MSPTTQKVCTHSRGPGTTVCLRCRYEERERARANFVRVLFRGTALVVVGGVIVVAVAGGAIQLRRQQKPTAKPADSTVVATQPVASAPPPVTAPPPVVAPPVTPVPAFATGLAMGRTDFSDSVYAMRSERDVRVFFDTQMMRTRRREKFESIVRQTLPRIYGTKADSALALVPQGSFAGDGDLITELPTRGIRLAVPGSGVIIIWPETREGRDGFLVVSYRTAMER